MRHWSWLAITAVAGALAQDLPTHENEEPPLPVDPPLLIQDRNADGSLVLTGPAATPAPSADLAKLEKDLGRAKRNAAGAESLYRAGIISKVEAEERDLRAVRLEAQLAEAKWQTAKQNAAEAASELAQAEEAAHRAAADHHQAELEAALRNLQRQQKLLALGSGRKLDLTRAEQKVAELQRTQP